MEESILAFRKAYNNLPEDVRLREVKRLLNIAEGKPVIVFEDHDVGKVYKFFTLRDLAEFMMRNKGVHISDSYLYKIINKDGGGTIKGFRVYPEVEEN